MFSGGAEKEEEGWNSGNDWNNFDCGNYCGRFRDEDKPGEKAGAESGLLAAKKDGKWGYINEDGEIVIPFEYDASWKHYDPASYNGLDEIEYCYAATECYVPLVKDGRWEMRDSKNEVIIPSGTFEEILPVHNRKCWVKKDGKWGVIQFDQDEK